MKRECKYLKSRSIFLYSLQHPDYVDTDLILKVIKNEWTGANATLFSMTECVSNISFLYRSTSNVGAESAIKYNIGEGKYCIVYVSI